MDVEVIGLLIGAGTGTIGTIAGFGGAWIAGRSARAKAAAAVTIAQTEAGASVLPHMLERIGDLEGRVDSLLEEHQGLIQERDDCVSRLDEQGRRLTEQERRAEDTGRESLAHQEQLAEQGALLREVQAATRTCVYRAETDAACAPPLDDGG